MVYSTMPCSKTKMSVSLSSEWLVPRLDGRPWTLTDLTLLCSGCRGDGLRHFQSVLYVASISPSDMINGNGTDTLYFSGAERRGGDSHLYVYVLFHHQKRSKYLPNASSTVYESGTLLLATRFSVFLLANITGSCFVQWCVTTGRKPLSRAI